MLGTEQTLACVFSRAGFSARSNEWTRDSSTVVARFELAADAALQVVRNATPLNSLHWSADGDGQLHVGGSDAGSDVRVLNLRTLEFTCTPATFTMPDAQPLLLAAAGTLTRFEIFEVPPIAAPNIASFPPDFSAA